MVFIGVFFTGKNWIKNEFFTLKGCLLDFLTTCGD